MFVSLCFFFYLCKAQNSPLFSSHGLDLTQEYVEEEILTKSQEYFQRMAAMKIWLEIKLRIEQGTEVEGHSSTTNDSHEKVRISYQFQNVETWAQDHLGIKKLLKTKA